MNIKIKSSKNLLTSVVGSVILSMDGEDKKTVILMGWRDVSAIKG